MSIVKFFRHQAKDISFKNLFIIWFEDVFGTLVRYIPGITGWVLRYYFYKLVLKKISGFCYIHTNVRFVHSYNIELGRRIGINYGCQFLGRGGIRIGNNCQFGPYVVVISYDHVYYERDITIDEQGYVYKPIIMEDDVWVGAHAVIMPGVVLKKGTVIGAGAVVTKSTEEYGIYVGNPAQFFKKRNAV